ncbi:MAG TPA: FHA domain-containing protein [Microlunatus sp.]|jgi:pSer/pThr/pTyr-binding forkhead associated (FHA) protein|nr:FHA domain-containing protein [Microlunatus sp.]
MPFCTNCGHDNPEGSNFCGQCGSALRPVSVASPSSQVSPSSPSSAPRIPTGDTTKTIPPVVVESDTEGLSAEDEAAVNALPGGSALLIVQRGPNAGSRFLLNTDQVSAGRHQDSDIFLDDISVSRRHATFTRTPDGTVLTDRGSLNGTYVNRDLVDSTLLRHGDEVQIGKFRLIFFASPQDVG